MTDFHVKAERIRAEVRAMQLQGLRLMVSSSFQTHSIPLLHILSQLQFPIPVVFLNTNYHFEETLAYKDFIGSLLGLSIREVKSPVPVYEQVDKSGRALFEVNKDACCALNKVAPMDALLSEYDVWISGIRGDQTGARNQMDRLMKARNGTQRYHPMLDWTAKDVYYYALEFQLPEHPLQAQGYLSIGCQPCTGKPLPGSGERSGRWIGLDKQECGLHEVLVSR